MKTRSLVKKRSQSAAADERTDTMRKSGEEGKDVPKEKISPSPPAVDKCRSPPDETHCAGLRSPPNRPPARAPDEQKYDFVFCVNILIFAYFIYVYWYMLYHTHFNARDNVPRQ